MVFLAPVELELDLHGLDYQPFTDWTVYWFNPRPSIGRIREERSSTRS